MLHDVTSMTFAIHLENFCFAGNFYGAPSPVSIFFKFYCETIQDFSPNSSIRIILGFYLLAEHADHGGEIG